MSPVVVGIDGSTASEAALRWAVPIAQALGTRVRAITVVPPGGWPVATEVGVWYALDPVSMEAEATSRLERVVAAAVPEGERWRVERSVVTGVAARRLVEESQQASMVVIGSRRRRSLHRLIDGTVKPALLRSAGCPVVVVPEHHDTLAVTASIDRALALAG